MTNKKERKITMKFNFTTFLANHSTATVGTIIGLAAVGTYALIGSACEAIVYAMKKHDEKIKHEGYLNGYMDAMHCVVESLCTTSEESTESTVKDKAEKKDANEKKVD